jgi:hypothetical protein
MQWSKEAIKKKKTDRIKYQKKKRKNPYARMKIIALDAAEGSEKERTAWWHHHPTPRWRLAVLSLSLHFLCSCTIELAAP